MSIKLMSAIYATKFMDLQDAAGYVTKGRTAKQILLALADHANDDGEGAYPSLTRMELKTDLSRQTIVSVYRVLVYHGIITLKGRSKFRTHNYTINPNAFPGTYENPARLVTGRAGVPVKPTDESSPLTGDGQAASPVKPTDESSPLTGDGQAALPVKPPDESSPLTDDGQAALPSMVKPLDLNRPLTILKPSMEEEDERTKMLKDLHFANFGMVPPLLLGTFRKAAGRFTNRDWYEPAFQIAVNNGARSWRYVEAVLEDWLVNGFGHKPERASPQRRGARGRFDPTASLLEYIRHGE